jgi:hypothetical protein
MIRFSFVWGHSPDGVLGVTKEFTDEHFQLAEKLTEDAEIGSLSLYERVFEADDLIDFASIFDGESECQL